jgi:hypothetical protein
MEKFMTADEMREVSQKVNLKRKSIVFTDDDVNLWVKAILDQALIKAENEVNELFFEFKTFKGVYPDDERMIRLASEVEQKLRALGYDVNHNYGNHTYDYNFVNHLVVKW